jgi:hypothetical protein
MNRQMLARREKVEKYIPKSGIATQCDSHRLGININYTVIIMRG